jgi:hypothetical protein
MWSPHGLGVRREDGSTDGAGRKRRSQAMWDGRGKKVQLKCGGGGKVLVAVGRAPFQKGAPFSRRARPFQRGRALIAYLIGRRLKPFRSFGYFLLFLHAAKS